MNNEILYFIVGPSALLVLFIIAVLLDAADWISGGKLNKSKRQADDMNAWMTELTEADRQKRNDY